MALKGHGATSERSGARGRPHRGVDLYASDPDTGKLQVGDNAPILVPEDGRIVSSRVWSGGGNVIEVRTKEGITHRFLHTGG